MGDRQLTSTNLPDGYVGFWIEDGTDTEFAAMKAADFRAAMTERDSLRAENERLRAGINLHQHDGYAGCTECGKAWPCPTIEATTPAPQPL